MNHSSYLFVVLLLCGQLTSGAVIRSVAPRAEQSLLAAMSVSGIDLTPDQKPCGPNQTVLTCAKNIAKTWQVPRSAQGQPQRLKIPVETKMSGTYIQPLAYIEASECELSDPILTPMGDTVSCAINSCSESFTFSTTTTKTKSFGFTSAFTLTASVEEGVPGFGKFTATASTTQSLSWTDTTSVATTTTTTKTWTLSNGEICSPTTIQYHVKCRTKIKLASSETEWPLYLPGNMRLSGQSWSCNGNPALQVVMGTSDSGGDTFKEFCQGLESDGQITTIDLGLPGYSEGRAWSMDGCMWPVFQNDTQS